MALLVGELYALLLLEKRAFMKGLAEAEKAAATSGKSITGSLLSAGKIVAAGLGIAALGVVAMGVESINAAQKFQSAMMLLHTQAGVAMSSIAGLSKAILDMSGSVGTGPDTLAAGLYHIESAGIRGAKALDVLKTAALGAKMGNADLEAVTNALIAEVNSGIPGIHNMSEAMGALNGIVGNGNMRMNDLALSMSTGILSVAKTFGVSMQSLGAAIATMTDQGVPAVDAATKLKSAIISMASPIGATKKAFASIGLSTRDLADVMKSPQGLVGALSLLKNAMDKAGLDSVEQGQLIANAFGKRGGPAVMTLLNSLGLVALKEEQIGKAANDFGQNVADMMKTTAFKAGQVGASLGVIAIQIGTVLLPYVNKFLDAVEKALSSSTLQKVFAMIGDGARMAIGALKVFVGVLATVWKALGDIGMQVPLISAALLAAGVAFTAWAVTTAAAIVIAFWPIFAIVGAVAIGLKLLDEGFKLAGTDLVHVFGAAVNTVVGFLKGLIGTWLNLAGTIVGVIAALPGPLQDGAKALQSTLDGMRASVDSWGIDVVGSVEGTGNKMANSLSTSYDNWRQDMTGTAKQAGMDIGEATANGVGAGALAAQGLTDQQMKDLGLTVDASLASGIDENGNIVGDATKNLVDKFGTSLQGVLEAAKEAGGEAMTGMAKGILDKRNAPLDAFNTLKTMLKNAMDPAKEEMRLVGELLSKDLAKGMRSKDSAVRAQAIGTKKLILDRLNELIAAGQPLGKKAMALLAAGMKSKDKDIRAAALALSAAAMKPLNATKGKAEAAGRAAAKGFGKAVGDHIAQFKVVVSITEQYAAAKFGPGYASGAWNIKRNQLAFIHQGEMVIPASAAQRLRQDSRAPSFSSLGGMSGSPGAFTIQGGIHLHGVGSDVSPRAASRFGQAVADAVADAFLVQGARRGIYPSEF